MTATFWHDGSTIERREAVVITTRLHLLTGAITVQPCDVCGTLIGPWWDFVIGGQSFTFCGKTQGNRGER